ncbi:hypothetical protein [Bernardetia sp.]|uniref:hypothetical protein n=1 Tax=Bernardetia sp. TaxID=1937974 RepID=UPI0025C2A6AE|nr:hypothetical protein [Bernardetia sp.]
MNNIEEILDKISEQSTTLVESILSANKINLSNSNLSRHYSNNVDKWLINLQSQIDKNPRKMSILLQHLWMSNFTVKFANDFQHIKSFEINNWSAKEKIDFISQTFENSYHYFILILLSQENCNTCDLYDSWYIIEKAIQNKWRLDDKKTSGKNWIISELKLFDFYAGDILRLRVIRNLNSHSNIIIRDEVILSLEEDETQDITLEVNLLTNFLMDVLTVGLHFTYKLIIEKSAWIYPLTVLYLENESNIKKGNFEILNKKENEYRLFLKDKPNLSRTLDFCFEFRDTILSFIDRNFDKDKMKSLGIDSEDLFLGLLGLIFHYTSIGIWRILYKGTVDKLLEEFGFIVDKKKISKLHEKSLKKIPKNFFEYSLLMKKMILRQKLSKNEVALKKIIAKPNSSPNLSLSFAKKIMTQMVKKDTKVAYGFLLLFIILQIGLNIDDFDGAISKLGTD